MIFKQGDINESYYVIIKGVVGLQTIREEFGNIPVNIKNCYEGDYFGALAHFSVSEKLTQT